MSRRAGPRITLGEQAILQGRDGAVPCLVIELSAGGARLAVKSPLPRAPLGISFGVGQEPVELPVVVQRVSLRGGVVVRFPPWAAARLDPLIEAELERAEEQGRRNVVERRGAQRAGEAVRGEVV